GRAAAIEAARDGKRAAVVERSGHLGGLSTTAGMVPYQTARSAIVALGAASSGIGRALAPRDGVTVDDLVWRAAPAVQFARDAVADELRRGRVDVVTGTARFLDEHTIEVRDGARSELLSAPAMVIAVGTRAAEPPGVVFDGHVVRHLDGGAAL